jgi:VanZ family protein
MIRKNIFSIIVALIILYLSLTNSDTFDKVPLFNIPHLDKIVHFLMYAGLMTVILFENRKIIFLQRQIVFAALIPFFYGILMELLQASLTDTRSGSIYDAFFNTAGIIAAGLIWFFVKPVIFRKSDSK